jgi:dTDP-4-amino-4,6-dideoxygalactose transaminase
VAEKLCKEVLSIPVHPLLSDEERWEVVESIRNFLAGNEHKFVELVKEENF